MKLSMIAFLAAFISISVFANDLNCTAVCTFTICDETSGVRLCHDGGQNLASDTTSLTLVSGKSFAELSESCSDLANDSLVGQGGAVSAINLYTTSRFNIRARYLQRVWKSYDFKADELNSCVKTN